MFENLGCSGAFLWIYAKHWSDQIKGILRNRWLEPLVYGFLLYVHLVYHCYSSLGIKRINIFLFWFTCERQYSLKLIQSRISWENGLSDQDFCQNTSYAPDICTFIIEVRSEQNLRRSVPPCGNFFGQYNIFSVVLVNSETSGQSEVANF